MRKENCYTRWNKKCLAAMVASEQTDVILAGGGLANSLIALRLKAARPSLRVVMLEQAPAQRQTHTWSFFETDVDPASMVWLAALTRRRWPSYLVRFPDLARELATGYASVEESRLEAAVAGALGAELRYGMHVETIEPGGVRLSDGSQLSAPLVIDGRGARPTEALWLGWQKFRGLEVRLKRAHGLQRPIIMDASVRQQDGFRFLYVLPFDPETLLIEDTRYSDGPALDENAVEAEVLRYARGEGWPVATVVRRETGVLPIALGGDIERLWAEQPAGVPVVGLKAALFHPTTGYSLPDAVRTAEAIAAAPVLESRAIRDLVERSSKAAWAERSFYRALNRMLFLAAKPDERWKVLARFYRMPRPLIERFYASRSGLNDRLRLVAGKPPVPIPSALRALARSAPAASPA